MRKHLLAALLIGAAFSCTLAAPLASGTDPPLCRVEATYRPLWWASNLRQITVRLARDCPPDGLARIRLGGYGGPGSRVTGPTETLNHSRPVLIWAAQPAHRTVLWLSASGKSYLVPLHWEVTYGVLLPLEDQ